MNLLFGYRYICTLVCEILATRSYFFQSLLAGILELENGSKDREARFDYVFVFVSHSLCVCVCVCHYNALCKVSALLTLNIIGSPSTAWQTNTNAHSVPGK